MEKVARRKIKWHPKTLKVSQIPKQGLEYAFCSKDYVQIHQFVWCKDFMQDVVYATVTKKQVSIYGFSYNPEEAPPLDTEKTRLLLNSFRDTNFGSKVFGGLKDFLTQIERQLKMVPTRFEIAENPHPRYRKSGIYLAIGSKRWMQSPPMISLYTMLLRVGLVHTKGEDFAQTIAKVKSGELKPYFGNRSDNDKSLLSRTEKGFNRILRHGDRKLFHQNIEKNYPLKAKGDLDFSIHTLHDTCGLVGFSSDSTAYNFPHWHRIKDE